MPGIEGSPEILIDVSDKDPEIIRGFGRRGIDGVVEISPQVFYVGEGRETVSTENVDPIEAMRQAEIARIKANGTLG